MRPAGFAAGNPLTGSLIDTISPGFNEAGGFRRR